MLDDVWIAYVSPSALAIIVILAVLGLILFCDWLLARFTRGKR